jgi:acetyl/propionyl-CoA carboxylase alpha subunit
VRVDTAGYRGYTVNPRYDSLLAKVITEGVTLEEAARRAVRALAEFDIAGVPVNVALLQALLQAPRFGTLDTGWVDAHAADLATAPVISLTSAADQLTTTDPDDTAPADPPRAAADPPPGAAEVPPGHVAVAAPLAGTVVSVAVAVGDQVAAGDELLVVEAMKMEHELRAQTGGLVREVLVAPGTTVAAGAVLVVLAESGTDAAERAQAGAVPLDHIGPIWPRRGSGTGSGSTRADPK